MRGISGPYLTAVVLAAAGLNRTGLFDPATMRIVDLDTLLPAPGQGALALQCRQDDARTRAILATMNDPATAVCVAAERALVTALDGDCHSPIAALAELGDDGSITLRAAVGGRDGKPPILRATARVSPPNPTGVAAAVFDDLAARGVRGLLSGTA